MGVANRVLIANAEQMAVASPNRRRFLAEAGAEEWVQGAVRRLGSVLASTLDPGAPPVSVTSVDKSSKRVLVVSAVSGIMSPSTASTVAKSMCEHRCKLVAPFAPLLAIRLRLHVLSRTQCLVLAAAMRSFPHPSPRTVCLLS